MPGRKALRWRPLLVMVALSLLLARPAPAAADGGPWTEDRERWTGLQEVEQIDVVKLESGQASPLQRPRSRVSTCDSGTNNGASK